MLKRLAAAIAIACICLVSCSALAAEPVKIGYLAALTGDYASYGQTEVNMAKLVVKDVNARAEIPRV